MQGFDHLFFTHKVFPGPCGGVDGEATDFASMSDPRKSYDSRRCDATGKLKFLCGCEVCKGATDPEAQRKSDEAFAESQRAARQAELDQMSGSAKNRAALFEAARSGHIEMAKWLVSRGADPDHANEWGDSPANEAASMGHWDLVWYLADSGANLTRTTEHSHSTLLLSAVRHRSTEALAELKRRGVDLTQRQWNGATAIHEAARTGETSMVDWLVSSSGIDINATNDQGEGAVHEAAMMGHSDAMWHLIRAGADTGAASSPQAASLVHSAVTHANVELLELLRSRGTLSMEADKHGRVPIIEAVRMGDKAVVSWLVQHGANVSQTSVGVGSHLESSQMAPAFGSSITPSHSRKKEQI